MALATPAISLAQEFPNRPIKLVMGFGPGGLGDIVGRLVGQKMSESIGKPIVIEYQPGAGGITAASSMLRAEPDGHTLLWVSAQNSISANLFKSLKYDWDRDFSPVGTIGTFAYVMYVHKDSPLKSVSDVVAAAKADPSKFNFSSIAIGTAQNLSALKFVSDAQLKAPVVPFKSTGEVITALTSGEVQVAFENLPGVIGQIRSGNLRAIAVSTEKRIPALPNVPTIAESGYPEYKTASWVGWVVPAKTPREIVLRLNKELEKAVRNPDVSKRLEELLIQPHVGTPEDLQKTYHADYKLWKQVISDAKIPQQ
jgi:tripartite-type tricarboxylate transporter receptor subunit TctC